VAKKILKSKFTFHIHYNSDEKPIRFLSLRQNVEFSSMKHENKASMETLYVVRTPLVEPGELIMAEIITTLAHQLPEF